MKQDKDFSYVRVCPETELQINTNEYSYSSGVCPRCGHVAESTFTHHAKRVGKWVRPSFLEYLLGKRSYFVEAEL